MMKHFLFLVPALLGFFLAPQADASLLSDWMCYDSSGNPDNTLTNNLIDAIKEQKTSDDPAVRARPTSHIVCANQSPYTNCFEAICLNSSGQVDLGASETLQNNLCAVLDQNTGSPLACENIPNIREEYLGCTESGRDGAQDEIDTITDKINDLQEQRDKDLKPFNNQNKNANNNNPVNSLCAPTFSLRPNTDENCLATVEVALTNKINTSSSSVQCVTQQVETGTVGEIGSYIGSTSGYAPQTDWNAIVTAAIATEKTYQEALCQEQKKLKNASDNLDRVNKGSDAIGKKTIICVQEDPDFAAGHAKKCEEELAPLSEEYKLAKKNYNDKEAERNQKKEDLNEWLDQDGNKAPLDDGNKQSYGYSTFKKNGKSCYKITMPKMVDMTQEAGGGRQKVVDEFVYCSNGATPPSYDFMPGDSSFYTNPSDGAPVTGPDYNPGWENELPNNIKNHIGNEIKDIISDEEEMADIGDTLEKINVETGLLANMCPLPSVPPWVSNGGTTEYALLPGPPRADKDRGISYVLQLLIPGMTNVFLTFMLAGIVLVIICAGMIMFFAGAPGKESLVQKTKDIIFWAIIGTIIASMAFAIVKFVIGVNFLP